MGTLKKKWGPNGDPKSEKGPHGDPGPQMGTYLGAVEKESCGSVFMALFLPKSLKGNQIRFFRFYPIFSNF